METAIPTVEQYQRESNRSIYIRLQRKGTYIAFGAASSSILIFFFLSSRVAQESSFQHTLWLPTSVNDPMMRKK